MRLVVVFPIGFLACAALAVLAGCDSINSEDSTDSKDRGRSEVEFSAPRGYTDTLEIVRDGRVLGFGPFVGYYFSPPDPEDLARLRLVCFNERGFYSSDAPVNAKLFEGEAVLVTLPDAGFSLPKEDRINPVFFDQAPSRWLDSRPRPRDEFVHFHSCYNNGGPVRTGYWIRHRAVRGFTYDMGGRVGLDSPLYHRVHKGPDTGFARIVEFDSGPDYGADD